LGLRKASSSASDASNPISLLPGDVRMTMRGCRWGSFGPEVRRWERGKERTSLN
jgi:hypothetical protein